MLTTTPPFDHCNFTVVGDALGARARAWTDALLAALAARQRGELDGRAFDAVADEAVRDALDVPAYAIRNPTCVGEVSLREPLAEDELGFVRRHTDRPVKVTLPGPYLLTRAMWVKEASRAAYPTKEDLGERVVTILADEVRRLALAGAEFIQFDEPVLSELVFGQGKTRTFMCAALAARKDPAEELAFAVGLLNRVLAAAGDTRTGVHVCRGNWSRDESTLLRGSYAPLAPWFAQLTARQLVLEYATPRAGRPVPVAGKELGLGVVNPRSDTVETAEEIGRRVEAARRLRGEGAGAPPGARHANRDEPGDERL